MSRKNLSGEHASDQHASSKAKSATQSLLSAVSATLLCLSCSQTVFAAEDKDAETDNTAQEIPLVLPAAPLPENLLGFYDSASMRFFIDTASLTVNPDSSVRYTLVSVSQSGARNISYEAILCSQGEKRLYAFGRPDGTWSRSRINSWDRISSLGANNQHSILAREFLCDGNTVAGKATQILAKLKRR